MKRITATENWREWAEALAETAAPAEGGEPLERWWLREAAESYAAMAPKVREYSAVDLAIMGATLVAQGAAPEGRGVEAAITFYALGKVARIVGALSEGRDPGTDSWHDLAVYARMALRVREVGGWPGPVEGEGEVAAQ